MESFLCIFLLLILLVGGGGIYILATGVVRVPGSKVGVVEQRFGRRDPRFKGVSPKGGPGPQATVLLANSVYVRPRLLYKVTHQPRTEVTPGTIGVVVAKDGDYLLPNQTLCRHVECDRFQDGRAFLLGGGQQGRQPDVLREGIYDINPELFEVLTVDRIGTGKYGLTAADLKEIIVPVGTTGVVIAVEGAPSTTDDSVHDGYGVDYGAAGPRAIGRVVPGHESFQLPWAFLSHGGQRGTQAETLSEGGVYHINPWFARVVLIPTRDLILEWTAKQKRDDNFDIALDQIRINVEGHWLRFDMSQIIRIPASAAPRLVGSFGEQMTDDVHPSRTLRRAPVQQFVEKVLGRTVEGYFQTTAGEYEVLDFVASNDEVRMELQRRVGQALAEWGVVAVRTTLNEFEPVGTTLDELRREKARQRDLAPVLEDAQRNADIKARIRVIELQPDITAEERRRMIDITVLQGRMDVMGRDQATVELFLAQLKEMGVPAYVGTDAGGILDNMPLPVALDMINRVVPRATMGANPRHISATPDQPEVPSATPEEPDESDLGERPMG